MASPEDAPVEDGGDVRDRRDRRDRRDDRGSALARSRHSRLDHEARPPDADHDPARAAELCGHLCRDLLGDFAPGLLLLNPDERSRVQALTAYARTLFDFARQHGVEGERLAQINRWEFTLEFALLGEAVGQPVFVAMVSEQHRRPWPAEALAELAGCARRRATRQRPADPRTAEADAQRLARAFATALLGSPPPAEVSVFAGALVRLHGLQNLGAEVAGKRCPLPLSELPDATGDTPLDPAALLAAARRECGRLRERLLRAPRGLVELPPRYRRAAVFSLLAALRLLSRIEDGDASLLAAPPRLGLPSRLGLLVQARWFRTG
jgi:phytoene/squalene synthetase